MQSALRFSVVAVVAALLAVPVLAKDEAPAQPANVLAVIKSHKELGKFADLIDSAGLEDMFKDKGNVITVFVPTDEAMGKMSADVAKRIKTDKAHTQSFVKYHAITGSQVFAGSIRNRRASPSSASGESLSFDGIGGTPKVNTAHLVMPDLQAPNGVVHIIDAALVPPSFTEPPAAKEPVAASPTAAGMEKDFTQENAAAPSAPAGAPQAEKSPSTGWKKIFGW